MTVATTTTDVDSKKWFRKWWSRPVASASASGPLLMALGKLAAVVVAAPAAVLSDNYGALAAWARAMVETPRRSARLTAMAARQRLCCNMR